MKHLKIEVAQKERKCHVNSKHTIHAGEQHLAEYDDSGARQNICMECAPKVLDAAEKHIAALRDAMKG
ncbi:hypothetical protein [Burkholderia multivorans]|uniref:hypothetical protein n=1 Tax=Burkholderia multivorans TaxID=87883 RepID=UPI0012DD5737|nr:hypothetical protein [Burkholderia multivorans]MBU9152331.1 hypothetical protein [Burkholderia multivorans]MCA8337468.1 hypothetical protein [Burkholderia multivorans]MDN8011139.1 hypothetical protein [Burkholderia multivorans]QGR87254.1 hypothetical protein FOC34_18735 [Burkholderia multivorans]UXZ61595.1 hypothetical protein NUJ28_02430 [Burkholderia multivorans]